MQLLAGTMPPIPIAIAEGSRWRNLEGMKCWMRVRAMPTAVAMPIAHKVLAGSEPMPLESRRATPSQTRAAGAGSLSLPSMPDFAIA